MNKRDKPSNSEPGKPRKIIRLTSPKGAKSGFKEYSGAQLPLTEQPSRRMLQQWWHDVVKNHGRYSCYAMLLVLPSDKEAIRYLTDFGKELDLVSGRSCLLLALGNSQFKRSGFEEDIWKDLARQHSSGFSVQVGEIFGLRFTDFPCLIVFKDIRQEEHIVITLVGKTAEQIADQMRLMFSIVQDAASVRRDPLKALERHQSIDGITKTGRGVISGIRNVFGKSFETAMQALIKAGISASTGGA
jgi:hypothetical protein